ncbi:MAG: U32 family peptidase [Bacteroidales bacterium]|jgi:putative protease|nr:U32 family peptidase [Bacteroidales bacterium]
MNREQFEIMAPVGSRESLSAALQAGADAVYFGAGLLNMRSRSSSNFGLDDLRDLANTCREKGVKSYLTVNSVLYDQDLPLMRQVIDSAAAVGVSAIIAADVAAMTYALSKGLEVHLSTQLNIANIEALRFYAQFADVVVLARELNLEQVAAIHATIQAEHICGPSGQLIRLEMFCHGALCMAVSGKCYLSLHEYNASANRGSCYQICRRGYTVTDNETGHELAIDNQYIMSPKDLKTIHFLNKMMDAGVSVFKIEGRARGPEYVKTVTACYREAIEAYVDGTFSAERIQDWDARLATVFNRGFWDGYYLGQRLGEWTHAYGSSATTRKVLIGKGVKYFSKLGVAEFSLESNSLSPGDTILITGPTTGALETVATEIHVNGQPVDKAVKGQAISIPLGEKIRPSDKLYKILAVKPSDTTQTK